MPQRHTKAEAEAVLRELPSVLGAFVREDVHGHPREVHLLVRHDTVPRELARDVRDLLEERLGVPVDQRVISIAQVAANGGTTLRDALLDAEGAGVDGAGAAVEEPPPTRLALVSIESSRSLGWIETRALLRRGVVEFEGTAREVESAGGAARAGARATAAALSAACEPGLRVDVETVSLVSAFDREHALVSTAAASPLLGRGVRTLVAAQPVEGDPVEAAALAVLKATNRVVALALASSRA
ncbi:MAG TPA: hypothetical protein VMN78_11370 [Longimicrobiales bacterium]|nr:hypothetical protein [Longimicrobiales bacterium]